MAGFAGFYKTRKKDGQLMAMMDRINHRGPDYRLTYEDDDLSLGFLGLDLGFANDRKELYEDEDYVVLLTGYIYNSEELIEYLSNKSIDKDFASHSEIICQLYRLLGDRFACLLKGPFIVVIYDKKNKSLKIARDLFGQQPIFYYPTEEGIIFASEIKAFLEHPDFKKEFNGDNLRSYLIFQSPSLKESFFKGAFKLTEGYLLSLIDGKITEKQYVDIDFKPEEKSLNQVVKEINQVMGESIEAMTRTDVEIGSFLSAGVDSSYIATRYKPKKAFTVGFEEGVSEIDDAKNLADIVGIEHISTFLDPEELFHDISNIMYYMDEPLANFSSLAIYYLSKLARKHVKVVLGGEGADEFFGGYFQYVSPREVEKFKKFTPSFLRRFFGKIAKAIKGDFSGRNFLMNSGLELKDWYIGAPKVYNEEEARLVLKSPYKDGPGREMLHPLFDRVEGKSDIIQKQYVDMHHWMINDINLKADRMTMAHSLQLITPVVSRDVLRVAQSIPDKYKVDGYKVKLAFRKAANEFVPQEWADRKKLGFPVPFKKWISHERFAKVIRDKVTSELAGQFFEIDYINGLFESHLQGKRDQHRKILAIYFFLVWYERFFIEEN